MQIARSKVFVLELVGLVNVWIGAEIGVGFPKETNLRIFSFVRQMHSANSPVNRSNYTVYE